MYSPVLLLGTTRLAAKSFPELMAQAKAHPGDVRWATAGLASLGHIMLEQISDQGKVQITHVPYKGGGQQMNDALGGQFEVLSTNAGPAVLQHIKAGKLKPLAVGAPARLDSLPDVPTLAELKHPAANLSSLFGIFAPAQTPAAVVARLNAEVNKALAQADLRAKLDATGFYDAAEVERVAQIETDPKGTQAQLSAALAPVADRLLRRYKALQTQKAAAEAGHDKAAAQAAFFDGAIGIHRPALRGRPNASAPSAPCARPYTP